MSKIRTNLYLDQEKLEVLKILAVAERSNVSDLVREAIDRIISDRMKQSGPNLPAARQLFNELLERVGKRVETMSKTEAEIEAAITESNLEHV